MTLIVFMHDKTEQKQTNKSTDVHTGLALYWWQKLYHFGEILLI
jgi:hypothetical protein